MLPLLGVDPTFHLSDYVSWTSPLLWVVLGIVGIIALFELTGLRYISNDRVGVVEKLWSPKGSVGEGRILALVALGIALGIAGARGAAAR